MNQPAQAIDAYRKAIEADPGSYASYLDFGRFYYSLGQYQRAEELFRRVTALVPAHQSGHSNLGATLAGEGRFKDAEESFRRALALDATPRNMSNLGALYHRQGRFSEALKLFEQSIAAGPPSPMRFANLGETYRDLHRSRESADAFRKALALAEKDVTQNPRQAFSRSLLASIAAQLGDASRAQFEIAQALQMDPKNASVLRQAVLTYEALNYRSKVIELLRDAPHSLVVELNSDAAFTALQGDQQFQELLAKKPNP
jgi:tetratricopeptide (TPR) repeat protein